MRKCLLGLLILCLLAGAALAAETVGQFTEMSGEVSVEAGGEPAEAAPLARVHEGDVVRLGAGATVGVAYFANDREEIWDGPGCFVVGRERGMGRDGLEPSEVAAETETGAVPEGLSKEGLGKGGQIMIRGTRQPSADKP